MTQNGTIMSREHDLFLQFVRLLKRYRTELDATNAAVGEFPECNVAVADRKKVKQSDASRDNAAYFRRLEGALLEGNDYHGAAEKFLDRERERLGDF
jgi:hypothetical protein